MSAATKIEPSEHTITKENILRKCTNGINEETLKRGFMVYTTKDGRIEMNREGQRYDKLVRKLIRTGKIEVKGKFFYTKKGA